MEQSPFEIETPAVKVSLDRVDAEVETWRATYGTVWRNFTGTGSKPAMVCAMEWLEEKKSLDHEYKFGKS